MKADEDRMNRQRFGTTLLTVISIVVLTAAATGCAARHAELDDTVSWTDEIVVREIGYDGRGLPMIPAPLAKRPSHPGDRFSVVRYSHDRPVISYDIVVKREKPDLAKPFKTVYEWTGRGFKDGAIASGALGILALAGAAADIGPNTKKQTLLELAVVATPVVVATVGGFVIGLGEGIKQTALEANKVVANGEQAITCTTYEYDHAGRLMYLRMYTPDRGQELVRTEYFYDDEGPVPSKTEATSLVEKKTRTVWQDPNRQPSADVGHP